MRRFIKSVVNIRLRPQRPAGMGKVLDAQYEKDMAEFGALPGINILRVVKARLHYLWATTGWRTIRQPPMRQIYPHESFTCKGPGLKHVDGTNAKMPWQPIHKSLTKTVHRGYTQNKQEILNRLKLAELLAEEPPHSDVSDQPVA